MSKYWSKMMIFFNCCRRKRRYSVKATKGNIYKDSITSAKEEEEPCFKRRYLISFAAFLSYFLMTAHRMNISIAILAMVNPVTNENHTISHGLNAAHQTRHYNSLSETQRPMKYDWSPQVQGFILGAGFFGYVFSLLIGGKLAERFGPRVMLISGTFASSFTTLITPFAPLVHVYFLIFIQCVRGTAQGFMLPSTAVLAANWYPKAERGLLAGIGLTGYQLGRLIGGSLSGFICESTSTGGWPSVFYVFGGFGILVSLLEFFTIYSMPKEDPRVSRAELSCILANQENVLTRKRPPVPWKLMFTSIPTYALLFGMCGQYWIGIYYLSSHASFVADILKYPIAQNGLIVSVPYIIPLALIPCVSYLSSWLDKNKYLTVDKIRKIWILLGSLGFSICSIFIIATKCEKIVSTVCSVIGIALSTISIITMMIIPVDMSPTFAGTLTALSTTIASFVGFFVPIVSGALTNEEKSVEQWTKFFIICIVIMLSSGIFFALCGSAEVQSYNFTSKDLPDKQPKLNNLQMEMKDGLKKEIECSPSTR